MTGSPAEKIVPRSGPLFWFFLTAGLGRLLSLGLYPLSDKTESRYAEIARIMAETGDWVTPRVDHGVPFWGKPPLSTWLSAGAIRLFGANEFAVRLPSFFLAVGVVALVVYLARAEKGNRSALAASAVLCATPLFFVSAGAVMTDPALVLGTTLSMVSFYLAARSEDGRSRRWGYLFFVSLAIGLLAKGPVALILTGIPLFLWTAWQRKWRQVWRRLPWLSGLALAAALTLPWYLLAERRTPGFLDYFIVGEHWKRFVEPGWSGDLYGGAHSRPKGTIWAFWLLTAFPWSLLVLFSLFRKSARCRMAKQMRADEDWSRYLLLWTVAPMLFFTVAGNILWTYVLPGLPAFSLLVATLWRPEEHLTGRPVARFSAAVSILLVCAVAILPLGLIPFSKTQKYLVAAFKERAGGGAKLAYLFSRPSSAQFYSGGSAMLLDTVDGSEAIFTDRKVGYVALRPRRLDRLPETVARRLTKQGDYADGFSLYEVSPP
ncbi:MAG: glycosyltransferase family 39 protein [Deltaproteobacteria bacterium]|nr:glycosyltransferase family 39 protein [Deltaproteobacteria bacterium]